MKRLCSASVHVSRGLLMTYGLRCRPLLSSSALPPLPPLAFFLGSGGGRPAEAAWAAVPGGAAMWRVRRSGDAALVCAAQRKDPGRRTSADCSAAQALALLRRGVARLTSSRRPQSWTVGRNCVTCDAAGSGRQHDGMRQCVQACGGQKRSKLALSQPTARQLLDVSRAPPDGPRCN